MYIGIFPGLVIAPRYVVFVFWSKCLSIGQASMSACSSVCCFLVRSSIDFFRFMIRPSFLHLFDDFFQRVVLFEQKRKVKLFGSKGFALSTVEVRALLSD